MADIELPNPEDIAAQQKDSFTKMAALTVAIYGPSQKFCNLVLT